MFPDAINLLKNELLTVVYNMIEVKTGTVREDAESFFAVVAVSLNQSFWTRCLKPDINTVQHAPVQWIKVWH